MRKHVALLLACALVFLPMRAIAIEEVEGGKIRGSRLIDNSVPPEKLKSETQRASHLFYRGDGTWASVYGTIANFSIEPIKLSAPSFYGNGARFYRDDGVWADVGLENGVTLPITGAMLDNATLQWQNFPSDMRPVLIVDNVATETCGGTKYPLGAVLYSKSDYKLYRCLADNTWTKAVPTTDLTGTLTDNQIASLNAAKLTGTITATSISDNVITTPMLKTGFLLAGNMIADNTLTSNLIADNAIIAGKLAAGSVSTSSVLADNIITNNMLVGGISAAKISTTALSSFTANLGTITTGTITSSNYALPTGSSQGSGLKVNATAGTIEAYGSPSVFGGILVSNDGNTMILIGKVLSNPATCTERYPAYNSSCFTSGFKMKIYGWDTGTSRWKEVGSIGHDLYDSAGASGTFTSYGSNQNAVWGLSYGDAIGAQFSSYGTSTNKPSLFISHQGTGENSTALTVNNPGNTGYGVVTTGSEFVTSPLVLKASAISGAPGHTALKGSLWVDSAGKLYINTNGSTTWQLVGSQTP